MKKGILSLTVTLILLTGVCCSIAEDSGGQNIRPYVTITGAESGVKERTYYRISSEPEWIKIWQRHKGVKETMNDDLYIDFEKCMVIAVFQGSGRNSSGLKTVFLQENKDGVVFRYEDKGYQTAGPGGGGKKVSVYGFFILPRSDKTVIVQESFSNMQGAPHRWEERVQLSK
jgi:hypothetical protein